jgi:hypothetical protein
MNPIAHPSQSTPGQEDKVMTPEQFERVMTAILEGKYSWACVLILRFAGYNPAHYIPYRTYKRLIKNNRASSNSESATVNTASSQPGRASSVNPPGSYRFSDVTGH